MSTEIGGTMRGPRAAIVPGGRADLALHVGLLGTMWGSGFLFVKLALAGLTPVEITFVRIAAAAAIMVALRSAFETPEGRAAKADRAAWTYAGAFAIFSNVLPYMLVAWAVTEIPTTAAAITNATTPIFTAVLAVVLLLEPRPGALRSAGIAVGLAGVALMFGFGFSGGSLLARLALLVAAFSYAVAFVLAGLPSLKPPSLLWLSASQLTIATVVLLPFAAFSLATTSSSFAVGAVASTIALGVISTGLATFTYLHAVRRVGPTSASLATYLVPVVGALLGVTFLHESIGVETGLGAIVVIIGVLMAERGRSKTTEVAT